MSDLLSECKVVRVGKDSRELIQGVASLYCRIFKEPPWNETHWTVEGVSGDLERQLSLPGAICLAVLHDEHVIGFTWGYGANRVEMAEIAGGDLFGDILPNGNRLFYIDELGVCNFHRHRHVGLGVSKLCLTEAQKEGFKTFCLRTDREAYPAIRLYQQLGFRDTGILDANHATRTYWCLEQA